MTQDKPNIVIISMPVPLRRRTVEVFIMNQLDLLEPYCGKIYLICANFLPSTIAGRRVQLTSVSYDSDAASMLVKVFKFLRMQLQMAYQLWRIPKKEYDAVFFYFGTNLLFPILVARIRGKRIAMLVTGSPSPPLKKIYGTIGRIVFYPISRFLEWFCCHLAHQLNIQSESAVSFLRLEKFRSKIVINGALYIDTELFAPSKDISERKPIFGYVGRLSWEKGVMNLIQAMPPVLARHPGITFLVVGEGPLYKQLVGEVARLNISSQVKFTDWVAHKDLPQTLNELRLFVLPSYTEGLPSSVEEAMSCGTPVLASSVGGIPDLIQDGVTGFLMPDNMPHIIAKNIIRALESPNLHEIALNGRELIMQKYSYGALATRSQQSIEALLNSGRRLTK